MGNSLQQLQHAADVFSSLLLQQAVLENCAECRKGNNRPIVYLGIVYMFVCYLDSLVFLRFPLLFGGERSSVEEEVEGLLGA